MGNARFMDRKLLLVDDEPNILSSLKRLFRREGYTIYTANSGNEGLEILAENRIGVIVSDQRMPHMTGVEFFTKVKKLYPDTVRIILSGYTDLNSVTDAINKGEIYKFLTKPWDDEILKLNVHKAFEAQNIRLESERQSSQMTMANELLTAKNVELANEANISKIAASMNMKALQLSQQILDNLPVAVLGLDDRGVVVMANIKAHEIFSQYTQTLIGALIYKVFHEDLVKQWLGLKGNVRYKNISLTGNDGAYNVDWVSLDDRGYILTVDKSERNDI
jgi:YesN/AraC family two-component response regulator